MQMLVSLNIAPCRTGNCICCIMFVTCPLKTLKTITPLFAILDAGGSAKQCWIGIVSLGKPQKADNLSHYVVASQVFPQRHNVTEINLHSKQTTIKIYWYKVVFIV